MKNNILLSAMLLFSSMSYAEVIYYNDVNIHEVKIKNQEPKDFFEKLTCGVYHCYGLKNKDLYAVGYNRQGQLGTNDTTSRKRWEKVISGNVIDIIPSRFGGCAILEKGLKYETGELGDRFASVLERKKVLKWKETKNCTNN